MLLSGSYDAKSLQHNIEGSTDSDRQISLFTLGLLGDGLDRFGGTYSWNLSLASGSADLSGNAANALRDNIGARTDAFDAVVTIAVAIDVDIVAGTAAEQIAPLAAGEGVARIRADDDVVSVRRKACEDRKAHIVDSEGRPVGERDRLDTRRIGT